MGGIYTNSVALTGFSGNIDASRINNLHSAPIAELNTLANKPTWVASTQAGVTLSSFSGNIDASRVLNLPSALAADWTTLTNKPTWVTSTQSAVTLTGFSENILPHFRRVNRKAIQDDLPLAPWSCGTIAMLTTFNLTLGLIRPDNINTPSISRRQYLTFHKPVLHWLILGTPPNLCNFN